jgi:hypothetical protein
MSDLTPRKRKLYQRIQGKESALCKLRKKYRSRKLKHLCDVDSDPLMQIISNFLNAHTVRLLAAIITNMYMICGECLAMKLICGSDHEQPKSASWEERGDL